MLTNVNITISLDLKALDKKQLAKVMNVFNREGTFKLKDLDFTHIEHRDFFVTKRESALNDRSLHREVNIKIKG